MDDILAEIWEEGIDDKRRATLLGMHAIYFFECIAMVLKHYEGITMSEFLGTGHTDVLEVLQILYPRLVALGFPVQLRAIDN